MLGPETFPTAEEMIGRWSIHVTQSYLSRDLLRGWYCKIIYLEVGIMMIILAMVNLGRKIIRR